MTSDDSRITNPGMKWLVAALLITAGTALAEDSNPGEVAATPAADRSIKARIVDISGVKDIAALFNVAHRSRFVFAAREITSAESRSGALWRSPLRIGEPLLPYYLHGDEIMATTLDGQTVSVPETMLLLSAPEKGVSFPTVKELDVQVGDDPERRLRPEVPTSEGLKLGKLPDGITELAADAKGRDAFFANQAAFTACYDAGMKSVDPDGKRFRFVQETYDKRSGKTLKMESLERVFDRQVCKKCNCLEFSTKRSKFIADMLAPLQQARFEKLSPVMDRTRALFAPK